MNREQVIQFVEGAFTAEMGAPWRWADLMLSKQYQLLMAEGDEYLAAGKLITEFNRLKERAGFRYQHRPKLYWRWSDKVRYDSENGEMITRVYLDGSPPYDRSNPQKPSGRPTVGQVNMCYA